MDNEEKEVVKSDATHHGVCDGIPCSFHTTCLPYDEVLRLCKEHEATNPGHHTSTIVC